MSVDIRTPTGKIAQRVAEAAYRYRCDMPFRDPRYVRMGISEYRQMHREYGNPALGVYEICGLTIVVKPAPGITVW